jgi:hypothetical protein
MDKAFALVSKIKIPFPFIVKYMYNGTIAD